MKKMLISGGITGIPREVCVKAFKEGKRIAIEHGWDATTPFDLAGWYTEGKWGYYMEITRDFIRSDECYAIGLLDKWYASDGATCEKALAHKHGKEVHLVKDLPTLHRDNEEKG